MLHIISAIDEHRAIGFRGALLFHLPADLRHFRLLTTGHTVVMGRKTFESLPKGALPNRRNIVLSRSLTSLPGCECFPSLDAALAACADDEEVFVIGGEAVYAAALPLAQHLHLTHVHAVASQADAFFPPYGREWQLVEKEEHMPDDKHAHAFTFAHYVKSNAYK